MKTASYALITVLTLTFIGCNSDPTGVGAKAPRDAEVLFDGSMESLDANWIYWEGPRFSAEMPISWEIVDDPVDNGTVVNSNDPAAAGGLLWIG